MAEKIVDVATPEVFVAVVTVRPPPAKLPLAPLPGAVNVTFTPAPTRLLPASRTVALSGAAKGEETGVLWPEPTVAVIEAGAPAEFVKAKLTAATLGMAADTLYAPVIPLAVKAPETATPEALVIAVLPPVITALAPLPGTAKVTVTPGTGLAAASRTVADKTAPKPVLTTAVWPEPLVTLMAVAAPAVFVITKLTPVTLGTLATIL